MLRWIQQRLTSAQKAFGAAGGSGAGAVATEAATAVTPQGPGGAAEAAPGSRSTGARLAGIVTSDMRWGREVLGLLLLTDAFLILLHMLPGEAFSIAEERGPAEIFEYLKAYWIAVSFLWIGLRTRERAYLVWPPIFGYILLDDYGRIHERVGAALARHFDFAARLGLRPVDFGELAVYAAAGTVSLLLVALAYRRGSATFRSRARWMLALLAFFAFCGGIMDMAHILATDSPWFERIFGVLEDGGEMVALSAICAYAAGMVIGRDRPGAVGQG